MPSKKSAFPLPLTLEEIDRDWLTTALRVRAPDVTVRGVEIVDVNHGTCTKVRLRLDLDEAGARAGIPQTVILKAGFEPHSREMAYMHETEVRGYRDIFPVQPLPSPACYYADFDAERGQGVIVMEDLVARGVTFCHPLRPQTHEQVARRLSVLAAFHARTWNSPDFAPGGRWEWLGDSLPQTRAYAEPFLQSGAWNNFIELPRGAAASIRFHSGDWMEEALEKMAVLSRREPHCLLHGDTHLGNLYVDPDGTPGFFDSLPTHGPAMSEVAYHVVCALDPADRPRWQRALVKHYLDELAGHGVAPPTFDEAMLQYGAYLARAYFIFVVNDPAFQREAINTAYVARISAAMLEHDTAGLLAAVK